jgi:DNA-binding PadR family transcriptional regulator
MRGGWRGGRVFDHGDLRLLILQLVAEKPRHGYELIKAIEERLGGSYSPSPGVVYPTLTMLEELGYATVARTEGGKKLYTVTPEGMASRTRTGVWSRRGLARMREAGAAWRRGPAPQILRAMEPAHGTAAPHGAGSAQRGAGVGHHGALDGAATRVEI